MIIQFKQWKSGAHRAPHKPLLFLYALGQWQQGIKEIPWVAAQPILTNLLNRFGVPAKKQTPENPWGRLYEDQLWKLTPYAEKINGNFSQRVFSETQSIGQFSKKVQDHLTAQPEDVVRLAYEILDEQFPPTQHADILSACGITT